MIADDTASEPKQSASVPSPVPNTTSSLNDVNRYYYLFEQSNDAVFLLDLNGRHIECNRRASEIFGYTSQELRTLHFHELSAEVDADAQVFQKLLLGQRIPIYEHKFRHKDGHVVVCEVNMQVVYDLSGAPMYIQSVLRDVTERKQLEEQLRASEELYRSVVTALSEGIVVQNADGHIVAHNAMAEQILGLTHDQLIGRNSYDPRWQAIHEDGTPFAPEDHPSMFTLRTGQPQHNVVMGVAHPDGKLVWISINSQPILKPDSNKPYAVVTSFTDITEWRHTQKQALKAALERERVTMLTRFVEHVAHEFRTPLSIINSSTYLLTHINNSDKQKHYQQVVEEQVMRITRLVDTLLLMTMLNAQTNMPLMITSIEHILYEITADAQTPELTITCEIDDILPPLHINPEMITKALRELIDNAKRHTPKHGSIRVLAATQDHHVVITVQDTGHGIPAENLPYIFETFWRGDQAHTTPGLGLGLAITQRIIEKHGGHIEVESTLGKGTTFTVWLPTAS